MSKKMILLLSHKLSEEQIQDAKINWGVEEFITLPNELQKLWSNFDAEAEKLDLEAFKEFVKNEVKSGDVVLIQGDFGATFTMVKFALELGLVPVYATTNRKVIEVQVNSEIVKKSMFKHRRFREYE